MISFPKLESWNATTKVATIAATVDKQRILCRVPLKILHDKYGPTDENPMHCVNRHREAIHNEYEKDGSVLICLANL
jgi:hypothetical protein